MLLFVVMTCYSHNILSQTSGIILYQAKVDNNCILPLMHKIILPSSVEVMLHEKPISRKDFTIDELKIKLLTCDASDTTNYIIRYRFLVLPKVTTYTLIDTSKMTVVDPLNKVVKFNPDKGKPDKVIASENLNYNGSFSRGFAVGNTQNLVLNSNFDMQLNGELGNGIKILAAISDDNIPIQPEGNTQVLQEFDKVFIAVSKDRTSVIAGDFELRRPASYFMNFQKKLKGLSVTTSSEVNKNLTNQTMVSIASSRGKFARQILASREGNQGPYRLQGNNNERFIIVLSNQEKVFFNGELLKRGLEYDYIIDYNSAEITFSPRRLIAKETRIIIEFEYTDLNYFRSLYHVRNDLSNKRFNLNFNFYSEQDSRNSTSQIELDSTDIGILTRSGDSRQASFRSGVRALSADLANSNSITYVWTPNPNQAIDGVPFILEFSTDQQRDLVTASFSDLGQGKGSYEVDTRQGLNGRIYRFVGKNKGRYDPLIELIPPEKKQMATLGGNFRISKNAEVKGELTYTMLDVNRFSLINDNDNGGSGGYLEINHEAFLDSAKRVKWTNLAKIERISTHFNPLNPYRVAEFNRDWNIDTVRQAGQNLILVTSGIKAKQGQLFYEYNNFNLANYFNGQRHQIKSTLDYKGWKGWSNLGLTSTDGTSRNTLFIRPNFELSKSFKALDDIQFGIALEGENNQWSGKSDSLFKESYAFDFWRYYARSNESKPYVIQVAYHTRDDHFAYRGEMTKSIEIKEWEVNNQFNISKSQRFNLTLKNRNFDVLRTDIITNEQSKNTLIGSLDYGLNRKGLQFTSNYQLSSGQEPKIEFIYQRVENNFGDFVYAGSDTANVKNAADFRYDPGNPNARYIRLTLPNSVFISTNNIAFNQSIRIEPRDFLKDKKYNPLITTLSKFDELLTIRINHKQMASNFSRSYNPFTSLVDTSLVSYNSLITNNVFFNRGNANFDAIFTTRNNAIRLNQLNGDETRTLVENELRARTRIYKSGDLIATIGKGTRGYGVKLFADRDYKIDFFRSIIDLDIRQGTSLRYNIKYRYEQRSQLLNSPSKAFFQDLSGGLNLRQQSKSSFDATVSQVWIKYDGIEGLAIEYDMLDGLKKGSNLLWNLNYTRRLNGVLDLNLRYEGRRSGVNPAVHIARAQVKATF
jgi:hypothetical protein